jgi:cytoskeletal protein CcmA (bactofilin family)
MFNSKGKHQTQKQTNPGVQKSEAGSCVISRGTIIEGKFKTTEDLRLDGTIIGEVKSEKKLVMGESGKIEGTVICGESSIKGRIEGELNVKGLLHLLSSAFIKGKIVAKKMVVDEGAAYNGECLIGEQHFSKESVKN